MRSFVLILLVAFTLACTASRLPTKRDLTSKRQAIAARQATRSQIIKREARNNQGLGRRQAQPSAGIYARCANGNQNPGAGDVVYAVVQDVDTSNAGNAINTFTGTTGQACAQHCFDNPSCQSARYVPSLGQPNCFTYGAVTRPMKIDPTTVSTYKGKNCATVNADFQVLNPGQGSISCCNYYGTLTLAP